MLTEAAPAKVNLFLHVTGYRADGLHDLDSLVVFAGACDTLTAEPADALHLDVSGPQAAALRSDSRTNLVIRAARLLVQRTGLHAGARLALRKHLPVASGIGGGSADAAATLRLLSRLWGVPLPPAAWAAEVGADVPVCLASRPARMRGAGETLGPAPTLPHYGLVLVNPGVALGTAEVFRARTGVFSAAAVLPGGWNDAASMARDLAREKNDLELAARSLCPAIDAVLATLRAVPGCMLARMSGSGASCFGLFADPAAARRAADELRRPGWWAWGGAPHGVETAAAAA